MRQIHIMWNNICERKRKKVENTSQNWGGLRALLGGARLSTGGLGHSPAHIKFRPWVSEGYNSDRLQDFELQGYNMFSYCRESRQGEECLYM